MPDKLRWTVFEPQLKKNSSRKTIATILPGHSDKKYHFPSLKNETETRYRVELMIMNLTKNDSGYEYQLEAVNVLGTGKFKIEPEYHCKSNIVIIGFQANSNPVLVL